MKTILFTGCTDGIGLEAAKQLVSKGHKVLIHGRNRTKVRTLSQELGIAEDDASTKCFVADLSEPSQVYDMVQQVKAKHEKIDVIVNNAGVFRTQQTTNKDGLDVRFAVNTLAPYILTKELLPIVAKEGGRVINVSSAAQAPVNLPKAFPSDKALVSQFNDFDAYSQSKLAMIMWTNILSLDYPSYMIASLNPASMIGTKMVKEGFGVSEGKDLSVGADILTTAAVGKSFARATGNYFDNDNGQFAPPHPDALNMEKNRQVVQAMEDYLQHVGCLN